MKRNNAVALSIILTLTLSLLTGCGKSTPLLTADDYALEYGTDKTSLGIAPGDTAEAFLDAYGEYKIFTSIEGGDYQMLAEEEIPFDSSATTLLPAFFVDGLPVEPDVFCEENEIEKTDLITFLRDADYLGSHEVEYRYLIFTWENGTITDISSGYMNYNEDGAN